MKSGSPCHKCPHGVADSEGNILKKHRGKNIKSLPCGKCKLVHTDSVIEDADRFNGWRSPVSLDGLENPGGIMEEAENTEWGGDREDWTKSSHVADFMRLLLRMDSTTQRIVSCWLLGESLSSIAARTGITVQAVHKRIKKAQKDNPQLKKAGDVTR